MAVRQLISGRRGLMCEWCETKLARKLFKLIDRIKVAALNALETEACLFIAETKVRCLFKGGERFSRLLALMRTRYLLFLNLIVDDLRYYW